MTRSGTLLTLALLLAACGKESSHHQSDPDQDGDGYAASVDCDDTDAAIHPTTGTCDGDTAHLCTADGSWVDTVCDPVQGSACDGGHCSGACSLEALGASSIGCDYYATPTVNSWLESTSFHFAVAVSNASDTAATVTVTQGDTAVATQTVAAGSVQVIQLPWTALVSSTATAIGSGTSASYRVRSTQPVTVYQFNPLEYTNGSANSYTNDAALLLPVTTWGTDHVVAARGSFLWSSIYKPGFYAVVASEDGTEVSLTPSATGGGVLAGGGVGADGSAVVTLDRGQVLQVLSGNGAYDLTGTWVHSSKPVQVLGGHDCTNVPTAVAACDHLEESLPQVGALGGDYLVSATSLPTLSGPKAILVRAVATEAGTTLTYDPPQAAWPASLASVGDYLEVEVSSAVRVTADKPVLVAQYMEGQGAGGDAGDPAMSLAVPLSGYRTSYLFYAPTSYQYNYVNILGPMDASILLDGADVGVLTAIGSSGYGVVRLLLSSTGDGNHLLTASAPVGLEVYGYGQYTSYWYPAGMDLGD